MNAVLLKSLVALIPISILLVGAIALSIRTKSVYAFLQFIGAAFMVTVVLTHICEALSLFPWMHWGAEHSLGHYLDLTSTVLGITLFPIGYLLHAARQT